MINRVLFLLLVFSTCHVSAQLTVRNNAYVFVNDEVIFVNDNVNIQEATSKIYLRNEAQLLQGTGTTGNSGLGELSVQQTGTADNYAYNYWCSPVGNNSASLGNESARANLIDESTGLITSNDALFTTAYDGIASPLTISNRWLYTFVVSDEYAEWIPMDETSAIAPGLGFTMKGIGAGGQLYDFRGKPNNGTISNAIAADQFTLIGNPYPSAIDALAFIHDAQNTYIDTDGSLAPATTGALYYWEQQSTDHFTANYIGGYATYTISAGGVETFAPATFFSYDAFGNAYPLPPGPGNTGTKTARRYIPIGQGFMVEGAPSTPGSSMVYVKNAHRVYEKESDGNSYFFRNSGLTVNEDTTQYNSIGFNIVPSDFKRFRLNIIFNQEFTRQLVHNFHASATDGFDYGLEAPGADDANTDASWTFNNEAYVIQAHDFDVTLTIPLVVKAENQQPVDFSILDIQNFDTAQPIYLHDMEAGIYVDLRNQNYSINLPAGIHNNRFEITFQNETLHTTEITAKDVEVFQNHTSAELTILNPNGLQISSVTLYDTSGKRVLHNHDMGSQDEYRISTKSLSEGVYVATVLTRSNQSINKKVIIKNK